jgi:GTP pyrophosphokinase
MSLEQSDDLLAPVLAAFVAAWPGIDPKMIEVAYHVAETRHRDEVRYSGDPYITHPVEVSLILAEHGAREALVCAALLHGTGYPPEWLRNRFGPDVATIVTGLHHLEDDTTLTSAGDDVLLLKLADRLHNMRTISLVAPSKQRRKATETLDTLVPLATRLGAHDIGRELSTAASTVLSHPTPPVWNSASLRALVIASALLPADMQPRWIAEWAGELATIETHHARLRFVATLLLAMPRLAHTLRHPTSHHTPQRTIALTIAGGASLAATINTNTAWAATTVALGLLALIATILLTNSDNPTRRLRDIIETWRNRPHQ